jgi:putative hydrolase
MRIDLHSHTLFSDGELVPAELVRRASVLGHRALAITDHVDMTNVEFVVTNLVKAVDLCDDGIRVIPGVEITHVPPGKIAAVAAAARAHGALWVVVHGETVTEPVAPGTNRAAVGCADVDLLAHPGMLSADDAATAAANGVYLEISGRRGHSITNGHVANTARAAGAEMLVNSDAHAPGDLMDAEAALTVALGAGLSGDEAHRALHANPQAVIRRL